MRKILYVILHGSIYSERKINIKETWGKHLDCLFYADYENKEYNVIKVSERSDYHSNEEKHVNVIKYLSEKTPNYEWFFFCDDDTFVNSKLLENKLNEFDEDSVIGSVINCWSKDNTLHYCSGGAGYLINHKILKKLNTIRLLNTGYSDVTLGLFLRENNIQIKNSSLFFSQNPKFYGFNENNITEFITFHYIKNKEEINKLLTLV